MHSRFWAAVALLLIALGARRARADPPAEPQRPRYWVDFEAGRVDVDGELNRLELQKNVKIRVDRYRLTSDHLILERSPRGVIVDGSGRLAFCPCESPPVTFGFRRAIVAPPTDLFVEQPVVYVGGVPVFWSPVLWLRSPDRVGMLPPRLAWRGDDGFVAGTGVHVPIGGKRGPTLETLDLFASGYVKGGVDAEATLSTEHTTSRVRFDYLRESLVAVDTRGSAIGRTGAGAAWHVDAIRGVRGRRGTLALEPASRRYDRGRLALGGAFGSFIANVGPVAIAPRGGAIREPGLLGPELFMGQSFVLGSGSSLDLLARAETLQDPGGESETRAFERSQLDAGVHLGPLRVAVDVSRGSAAASTELASSVATWGGIRTTLSAPFARAFGAEPDPVVHVISPVLEGGGRVGVTRLEAEAPLEDVAFVDETQLLALAGADTSVGSWAARSGVRLGARAGFVGPSDEPLPVAKGKLIADTRYLGARLDGGVQIDDVERLATSGRVRFGRLDTIHLSVFGEGRLEREPILTRLVLRDSWDTSAAGWYDREGFSGGSEIGVAWTRWLATSGAIQRDLTRREWLELSGALGYRHPCGCLALYSWLGHRLGRDGIDVQVAVDLMP